MCTKYFFKVLKVDTCQIIKLHCKTSDLLYLLIIDYMVDYTTSRVLFMCFHASFKKVKKIENLCKKHSMNSD